MRNLIRTALILGTLTSTVVAFADTATPPKAPATDKKPTTDKPATPTPPATDKATAKPVKKTTKPGAGSGSATK